ncbi:MAG TPA: helix-turn-helix domain-containing protein [Chloroflexia bacterium]|nr:helix-turn-helix domain-containing protein [Chloroflexia bacterium]
MLHGKTLYLDTSEPDEQIVTVLKALASLPRWRIMQCLASGGQSVNAVAEALHMPLSTVAAQIKILQDAGVIHSELRAASHGLAKTCTRTYDNLVVEFPFAPAQPSNVVEVAMPIGAYGAFEVTPTCGLASETSIIGYLDDPISFYEPGRVRAGLLWFHSGYLEYTFPNRLPPGARPSSVQVSMEICSEAPLHNDDWPSDITVWINGHEIGTWTAPGDFGGRRGQLTPVWWDSKDTQYGLLKRWVVTGDGAFLDGHPLSPLAVGELDIEKQRVVTVRLGVKPDALHVGGLNLFGQSFGNYPQDLTLRLEYVPARREGRTP